MKKTLKKFVYGAALLILLTVSASAANADVNEILTFTNFTDEEIYVELSIFDNSGLTIYDLYVLPDGTSLADFWADTFDATYSACAYGELSGDYYGCMDGYITDFYNNVYFDAAADPYVSTPSGLPTEVFVLENPNNSSGFVTVEADVHGGSGGGGCFIGSLLP